MASAIGTARIPTHGSWRPVVTTSTGLPATSIVRPGLTMLDVGLIAMLTTQVLAGRDAAERAAGVVRQEAVGRQFVAMLRAALRDAGKAGADLDALDRVDAHHRVRDVGIEPVEHGLAEPGGTPVRDDVDARADRIAFAAQRVDHRLELRHARRFGAEERVGVDRSAVVAARASSEPICAR